MQMGVGMKLWTVGPGGAKTRRVLFVAVRLIQKMHKNDDCKRKTCQSRSAECRESHSVTFIDWK